MNKKGFTIVELIVSFTLVALVSGLLFEMVFILKDLYTDSAIRTQLLTKQALMSERINNDLSKKTLMMAYNCGTSCIEMVFTDGTVKDLSFNRNAKTFTYGDYKTKLIDGSQFGNIDISTQTILDVSAGKNNSIIKIQIPVFHEYIKREDFGVNIAYQYDNREVAVSGLFVSDVLDVEKRIYLIGASNDIAFVGIPYTDPGYFVVGGSGGSVQNDPSVVITGEVGDEVGKTYTITYTIYDSNGNVMHEAKRNVTLVNSVNTFNYTGSAQAFKVPIGGLYKIEVWGAQGGSTGTFALGGKGGYTVGQINLAKGTVLNIYAGGAGTYTEKGLSLGGFNGGGNGGEGSELSGASGGGASDVRMSGSNISNAIIVAGGGGGAGSRNQVNDASIGGAGGGASGLAGAYPTASYNGGGATSSAGGSIATYNSNITSLPTAGSRGIGGSGGTYASNFGGGGGGAGYYGGGGAVRYGAGGGGSGYCGSMLNCTTYDGTTSFPSVTGLSNETGHSGNGVVKITLISISN